MSNPYPAPTDAAGRAWFLGLWDSFAGLLGSAATPASARDGLLLPKRAAKNLLVNPNFSINQRGLGVTGFPDLSYVRDKWQSISAPTLTAIGSSTGRLSTTGPTGRVAQTAVLVSGVTYTFSNTGTAKLRVWRVDEAEPAFVVGSITFTATSSTISYEFALQDGTLGTALLEEGAFATESEQRSDLEELRICQQYCYRYIGGMGSARATDNLYESMLHLPVPFASNAIFEGTPIFTTSAGSSGTPQIYVGPGSPASPSSVFIKNAVTNWTVGAQVQLDAVFVPS
jgi:hypothetical protein